MKTTAQVAEMFGVKPYIITRAIRDGKIDISGIAAKAGNTYIWSGTDAVIKKHLKPFMDGRNEGQGRPKLERKTCSECGHVSLVKKGKA